VLERLPPRPIGAGAEKSDDWRVYWCCACAGQQSGNHARAERERSLVGGRKRDRQRAGPVAQILESVPLAFFCGPSVLLLRFLGWLFGGVGFHGGPGFGRGNDHGFRAPEVHGNFGHFFGGIA
jgi:hypothetical protein